ncbi:helix-turn-helix transcriptional regulator [Lentisalinibacter sediminis]|uniref:helix-turn-helix transcriptional regulator n=1 Tax=Lentisalinibacter sediminis TaxID=2992237 RepID=UPI00386E6D0E
MTQTTSPIEPVMATVDQACAALGIGRTAFYQLVKDGLIRPVKIGTKGTRVPVEELRAVPKRLRARTESEVAA